MTQILHHVLAPGSNDRTVRWIVPDRIGIQAHVGPFGRRPDHLQAVLRGIEPQDQDLPERQHLPQRMDQDPVRLLLGGGLLHDLRDLLELEQALAEHLVLLGLLLKFDVPVDQVHPDGLLGLPELLPERPDLLTHGRLGPFHGPRGLARLLLGHEHGLHLLRELKDRLRHHLSRSPDEQGHQDQADARAGPQQQHLIPLCGFHLRFDRDADLDPAHEVIQAEIVLRAVRVRVVAVHATLGNSPVRRQKPQDGDTVHRVLPAVKALRGLHQCLEPFFMEGVLHAVLLIDRPGAHEPDAVCRGGAGGHLGRLPQESGGEREGVRNLVVVGRDPGVQLQEPGHDHRLVILAIGPNLVQERSGCAIDLLLHRLESLRARKIPGGDQNEQQEQRRHQGDELPAH